MRPVKLILSTLIIVVSFGLAPSASAELVIASGSGWDNVGQRTSGSWSIVERDGSYFVELGQDFRTQGAPDLKIFLSTEDAETRNNSNGLENTTFIAELTSRSGSQSYRLPDGVDPAAFTSLVIYCQAFSKFWAAANI